VARLLPYIAVASIIAVATALYLRPRAEAPAPVPAAAAYADPASCRQCHAAIAASYQSTGMARAFYKPTPQNVPLPQPVRFTHTASAQTYEMTWRDGKLVQRRWTRDPQDALEMEVHWVIGSGNHARTFLHQSPNGEITELPLSWYSAGNKWGMSPGLDKPRHPDFTRQLDHGCMFCHNGYPAAADDRFGRAALFPANLPQGIDCQRCHGPGATHAAAPGKGNILNPSKLAHNLQMDICLQCHLETTSAALPASTRRSGRGAYSYRPGEPLTDFMVHFDHPPNAGHDGKFEIVGAAYRLRQSPCYQQSDGRLTCTTCHDPHKVVRGAPAVARQRQICLQCHQSAHRQDSDCASCHMPKRRTEDAVEVIMTDHRIARRPPAGDLLGPRKEKEPTYRGDLALYYPASLPESERDLYLGMALAAHGADRARGISLLESATRNGRAGDPKVWAFLGDAHMAGGDHAAAIGAYAAALQIDAGLEKARFNYAQALAKTGNTSAARQQFEQLSLPEARTALGELLARSGDVPGATAAFRQALQARPHHAAAHMGLGSLQLAQGDLNAAFASASAAHRADPANSEYRLNRARILYLRGQHAAATEEFERIVREAPTFAEAHLSLGIAYGEAGRLADAAARFREVLRLQPGHPEATRNLALATQK